MVSVDPVAQSVEHNTFNVGVPGSSPGGITENTAISNGCRFFVPSVAKAVLIGLIGQNST